MHIPSSSASRARFATSSLSKFSPSFSLCRTTSLSSSSSSSQSCVSFVNQRHRSLSFSSALSSLRCSSPRWSHGAEWRSPVSLRAQARITAPFLERFERKMATIASEHAFKEILTSLPKPGGGEFGKFYSLPALNDPRIDRLPYSIRILLESAIRNCDNFQVTKDDVEKIIDWENTSPKLVEIPFKPARVLLQDFTGVPAVVDLACMRDAMKNLGSDPQKINPLVPVDLVIDHSVQVDVARSENAVQLNMELEFQRNKERFAFLKWGSYAFHNMLVVPPGSGIVHQVNLEYLGRVVFNTGGILYPDSVVGTDSHTMMIDGLGVAGWGVGGIEAEAAMLGQEMAELEARREKVKVNVALLKKEEEERRAQEGSISKNKRVGKVGGPDLKSFIQQFEGASEGDRPQEAYDAKTGVRTEETEAEKSEPMPDSSESIGSGTTYRPGTLQPPT